jgi:DNA invertase Pin-like site-specific DNA recombinase
MAVYASMCLDRPAGRPKPTPRNSRIRECAQPRVTGVRRDEASGRMNWCERAVGKLLTETAQPGDIVMFPEISRMARSTLQVLEMLEHCARCGITVHVAKQKMVLDGSMQSHITATVLGLAAEIEREFISLRTSEAMARRKAQGLASVGRKVACPRGLSSMPRKRRSATISVRRSGSAQLPSWWAARPRRSMNGWPVAISGHGNARRPSGGLLQQWPHPSKMGKWAHPLAGPLVLRRANAPVECHSLL